MKYKSLIIALVAIVVIVLLNVDGCSDGDSIHGNSWNVETTRVSSSSDSIKLSTVYVNVDNSGSMKGYLDFSGYPQVNNNLVAYVTRPLDYFKNNYNSTLDIRCGTTKTNNIQEFRTKLNNGSILTGAVTELDKMIIAASKQVSDTTISIIVSDLVLSAGLQAIRTTKDSYLTIHKLDELGSTIHTALMDAKSIGVLIMQYYNDFNGNYYYNCTENTVNGHLYKNSLLHKRPYYIMVLGTPKTLKDLLAKKVFAQYNNIYASFGVNSNDMQTKKYSISADPSFVWQYNNDVEDPEAQSLGTLWTKTDMGNVRDHFTVIFDKFEIPAFVGDKYEIGDYSLDPVIDNIQDVSVTGQPYLSFKITMKPFDILPIVGESEFTLVCKSAWTNDATIDNDADIDDIKDLEGKTFGFRTIIKNIDDVYYGLNMRQPDVIARVRFKISKEIQ